MLKKSACILFLLAHTALGAAAAESITPRIKLCLTGTLPKVFPNYGESFQQGVDLAIADSGLTKDEIVVESYFYDQNPLAPDAALSKMLTSGCHAVLGFDFTNDLMLIREKSKAANLLILSMYGAVNETLAKYDNIQTFQVPPKVLFSRLLLYARGALGLPVKNPALITTVDLDELKLFRDEALAHFFREGLQPTVINQLESSFKVEEVEKQLRNVKTDIDAIFLFTRSRPAAETADMLDRLYGKKTMPSILGTKFFGTSTLPAFRNMLKKKDVVAHFTHQASNEDPDPAFRSFYKKFLKKHGDEPMGLAALAYDATSYLAKVRQSLKVPTSATAQEVTKSLLLQAQETEFSGLTGVTIKRGLKFSYDKVFVIRTDIKGYHLAQ